VAPPTEPAEDLIVRALLKLLSQTNLAIIFDLRMRQVLASPRLGLCDASAEDWLREYTINRFGLLGSTPRGSRPDKANTTRNARGAFTPRRKIMVRKLAIMFVAATTLGAASLMTPALAFRGGGGGFHGGGGDGFRGGGFRGGRYDGFYGRGFGGFYGRGFGGFYGGGFGYYGGYPFGYPFYYYPYYGYYSYGR
jgi:hypothetical protein